MGGGCRRTVTPPHCPPIATCCLHVAKNINARTGLIKKIRMSIEITLQIVIGGVPFSMNPHVRLLVVCQSVILRIPPLGALFLLTSLTYISGRENLPPRHLEYPPIWDWYIPSRIWSHGFALIFVYFRVLFRCLLSYYWKWIFPHHVSRPVGRLVDLSVGLL